MAKPIPKRPTPQQQRIGHKDLRGNHWLFRGVAGSGKSVMLALNAARSLWDMHTAAEDATVTGGRVLVCCYNKTLVPFLRQTIEDRYARLTYDAPPAGSLTVLHFEKVVADLAAAEPTLDTGLTFRDGDERSRRMAEAFDRLPPGRQAGLGYDHVYLDEAQDLSPDDLRLLRRLARPDAEGRQSLAIFYDNAQNIYGRRTPTWDELGIKIVGRTDYLDACKRNTRQIVELPFNVLVGTHAPEGERPKTRQFADLGSLRDRKLIDEDGDGPLIGCGFVDRDGPPPEIRLHKDRAAETRGIAALVRRWVRQENVLPADILILHAGHQQHEGLADQVAAAIGPLAKVRQVDKAHDKNKRLRLVEPGVLTISTLHSAKGYDAPLVILAGLDRLKSDVNGRAQFYVAATRAKHQLVMTAATPAGDVAGSLFPEIVATAGALGILPTEVPDTPPPASGRVACKHCGSGRLCGAYGKYGYYFRCEDCGKNTPPPRTCPRCDARGKLSKRGRRFAFNCPSCGLVPVHENAGD